MFVGTDWQRLRMLAPLVNDYFEAPAKDLLGEIRLNEAPGGDPGRPAAAALEARRAKPDETKPKRGARRRDPRLSLGSVERNPPDRPATRRRAVADAGPAGLRLDRGTWSTARATCSGEPVELTDELCCFIYRAYEVYPRDHERRAGASSARLLSGGRAGRRRSLRPFIAIAEMDPTAPVRCDGWRAKGRREPVGGPVRDPYIPMVAYTEEQTAELAYSAVYEILSHSPLADSYDLGLERIIHATAPGKIQRSPRPPPPATAPARPFQHFDETHRFTTQRLKDAHATMHRNIPKRKTADAWSLEDVDHVRARGGICRRGDAPARAGDRERAGRLTRGCCSTTGRRPRSTT